MDVILDTCAFLFLCLDDSKLSAKAKQVISDPSNRCLLSIASVWEIAIKTNPGHPNSWPLNAANAYSNQRFEYATNSPYITTEDHYSDACYCGHYPTREELDAMEAEADALRPVREPMTDTEWIEAEELRNFFGRRQDA